MSASKQKVGVLGVPLDLGAGRRGTDMGPSAIRLAGLTVGLEKLGVEARDHGYVAVAAPETRDPGRQDLRFGREIERTCGRLRDRVRSILAGGARPLVLGGDHSIAMGSGGRNVASHLRRASAISRSDCCGSTRTPTSTRRSRARPATSTACRWRPFSATAIRFSGGSRPCRAPMGRERQRGDRRAAQTSMPERRSRWIRDHGITRFHHDGDRRASASHKCMHKALRIVVTDGTCRVPPLVRHGQPRPGCRSRCRNPRSGRPHLPRGAPCVRAGGRVARSPVPRDRRDESDPRRSQRHRQAGRGAGAVRARKDDLLAGRHT